VEQNHNYRRRTNLFLIIAATKVMVIFKNSLHSQNFFLKKSKTISSAPLKHAPMLRKNKQVLLFNDKEMEVISYFCRKYKIVSKSRFFRETIIAAILRILEEDYPTLF